MGLSRGLELPHTSAVSLTPDLRGRVSPWRESALWGPAWCPRHGDRHTPGFGKEEKPAPLSGAGASLSPSVPWSLASFLVGAGNHPEACGLMGERGPWNLGAGFNFRDYGLFCERGMLRALPSPAC